MIIERESTKIIQDIKQSKELFIEVFSKGENPLKYKPERILIGTERNTYELNPKKHIATIIVLKRFIKEKTIIFFDAEKNLRFLVRIFGKNITDNEIKDLKTACKIVFFEIPDMNIKTAVEKILEEKYDERKIVEHIKRLYQFIWKNYRVENNPVYKMEIQMIRSITEMPGFKIDIQKALLVLQEKEEKFIKIKNWIKKEYNIEPSKNIEVAKVLENQGVNLKKTKTGLPDTSEQSLQQINHPLAKAILKYRKIKKEIDTIKSYVQYTDENERVISVFSSWATASGRMISKEPNIQNVPGKKEIRELFVADKNNVLIAADFPQIELRIAAHYTKDQMMIDAFKKGIDLHRLIASRITGKPIEQITEEERKKGKAVNFGALYGMGAKALKEYAKNMYSVKITYEEAKEILETYRETFKQINQWHRKTAELLKKEKMIIIETLAGRKLIAKSFTNALNYPIQGSGADLLKYSVVIFNSLKQKYGLMCNIVNLIHDEIIVEAHIEDKDKVKKALKISMEKVFNKFIPEIPIEIEVKEGKNWNEIK